MAEYPINKGIGRPVEFKGLKAQYEDGGVVTHVVGRIGPGAHHAGYLDLTHGI